MDPLPLLGPQAEGTLLSNMVTKEFCDIIAGNLDMRFLFPETLVRRWVFLQVFSLCSWGMTGRRLCHGLYILAQDCNFIVGVPDET